MTGDGTNDASALAQADVEVTMNTATSVAKEASNVVDLSSNLTKLIEMVEINKQTVDHPLPAHRSRPGLPVASHDSSPVRGVPGRRPCVKKP